MNRQLLVISALGFGPWLAIAQTHVVLVKDFEFLPKKIHIVQGETVRWENRDKDRGHSVQIKMEGIPESDKFYENESFSYTFKEHGEFPYFCGYHPGMKGVVYVIADPSKPPVIETTPVVEPTLPIEPTIPVAPTPLIEPLPETSNTIEASAPTTIDTPPLNTTPESLPAPEAPREAAPEKK